MLIYKLGRRVYELWLFITDMCNVKCNDCLTESYACTATRGPLALPEIKTWVNVFAPLGTSKIRITPDYPSLIKDSLNIMKNYTYASDFNHLVMLDR
jgi:cyclic pyranopterin phosphate synthase